MSEIKNIVGADWSALFCSVSIYNRIFLSYRCFEYFYQINSSVLKFRQNIISTRAFLYSGYICNFVLMHKKIIELALGLHYYHKALTLQKLKDPSLLKWHCIWSQKNLKNFHIFIKACPKMESLIHWGALWLKFNAF